MGHVPAATETVKLLIRPATRPWAAARILTIKSGHLLRFDPNEIAAWIDESRRKAHPPLR